MPRPLEFYTQKQSGVSLPACRGCAPRSDSKIYMTAGGRHTATKWATLAWLGGGVRLDFVGDYRTMAFSKSIAYTPSVTPDGVTALPTQGSLFSEHPTPYSWGKHTPPVTLCSGTAPSGRGAKGRCVTVSPYRPSSVMACAMPPSPRGRRFRPPEQKITGTWLVPVVFYSPSGSRLVMLFRLMPRVDIL